MKEQFTWIETYNKIAHKLLDYKDNRKALVNLMYEILEELNLFNENDEVNCNLDKYQNKRCKYDDIDPFTFMNRLAIYSNENRKKFIKLFAEKTNTQLNIPEDFDGVPTVNPRNSSLIQFKDDRGKNDIDDFWIFFETALELPKNPDLKEQFIKYYDILLDKPNCGYNISSCLFRMDANNYFSLDSTNRTYLADKLNLFIKEYPNGEKYLDILEKIKEYIKKSKNCRSYADLSYKAWKTNEENKIKNRIWLYSPGENACNWEECLENKIMTIGWDNIGNFKKYENAEEIKDAIEAQYFKENAVNDAKAVDDFLNVMDIGDTIIVKKGKNTLLGCGKILSDYYYDDKKQTFKNCRKVDWFKIGIWNNATDTKFVTKTLTDITKYKEYCKELLEIICSKENEEKRYFWLNANPKIWSFSEIKPGETIEYSAYNENNNKRRIYQRFEEAKIGDEVLAYETTPVKAIVGICKVDKSLKNNAITFRKIEQFAHPIPFKNIKDIPELKEMEYFKNNQGSLFKVTNEEYNILMDIIREENPVIKKTYKKYSSDEFLDDVYMTKEQYEEIKNLITEKQNIILQGSPGVGKTYMAKKLVYSLIEEQNNNQIEMIEFHQNYSYEDFIEGYRPNEEGKLELEKGIFLQFCLTAENNPDKDFYLIIDEINRGNLSKIFGELLMLIEKDKRETSVTLAYSKVKFKVPKNLYLIGLMNTADRSIAIIDYALRRRFSFVDIMPAYENVNFKEYIASFNNEKLNKTVRTIKELNKEISSDVSLGEEFMIGHSYFCNLTKDNLDNKIDLIIKYEIKPLLKEYWFDNKEKLEEWKKKLEG